MVAGYQHACALDGHGAAWCWGDNRNGQRGDGRAEHWGAPQTVAGNHEWAAISADTHTCALDAKGAAWCWGGNEYGELGSGTAGGFRSTPTAVTGGHTFTAISVTGMNSCALDDAGSVWCWAPKSAPAGNGTMSISPRPYPVRVPGSHEFTEFGTGALHACALDTRGKAWCWGDNEYGQLGVRGTGKRQSPVAVRGKHTFTTISVGAGHSCAIDTAGIAWCWGDNSYGEVSGEAMSPESSSTPIAIDLPDPLTEIISGKGGQTCALDTAAHAWCWGYDVRDPWADEEGAGRPMQVPGGPFTSISPGETHNCAIDSNGVAWCWGENDYRQLGERDPLGMPKDTPVPIDPSSLPTG